ncbi:MAG: hypothetical protein JWO78_585 [Micavibrio sp.]|nr:hypothetical protein [Micavibrio sp.]
MLHAFPNHEFLENLKGCCSELVVSAADITGRGNEGVIVMTSDAVRKIYGSAETKRSLSSYSREQSALFSLSGGNHRHFVLPQLKSATIFQSAFSLDGISYTAMIEQSRIRGEVPRFETAGEQKKLGMALGEFHLFLKDKAVEGLQTIGNLLRLRINMISDKGNEKTLLKPGARKRLLHDLDEASKAAPEHVNVHGDFRPGNFLYDSDADVMGILDLTTIGQSLPEQDFAHMAGLPPEKLGNIFNGYKDITGYRPRKSVVQKLHLLDIAVAMNCAAASRNITGAQSLRKRFDAVWNIAYKEDKSAGTTPTCASGPC